MLDAVRRRLVSLHTKSRNHLAMLMVTTPHFRDGLGPLNASGSPGGKANTVGIPAAGVCTPVVRGTGIDDGREGLAT